MKSESFDDIFAEYLEITYRALDMEELFKAETKCGNGRYSEEFEEKNLIWFMCLIDVLLELGG